MDVKRSLQSIPGPRQPSAAEMRIGERIASLAGGGLLTWYGLRRRGLGGSAAALAGAALMYHGAGGYSTLSRSIGLEAPQAIRIRKSITIRRTAEEVYAFWRHLENLPRFMKHLKRVEQTDATHSHWTAALPGGQTLEWDAKIIEDQPNTVLRWVSLPDSSVRNTGTVEFRPAPGNRGTEIHVDFAYEPGAGRAELGRLARPVTAQLLAEELRRCKQVLEAGEIPTTEGQTSCRRAHQS